jgi:thioesterase domain-containing protein
MKADEMTIPDLLAELAGKDIAVWVESDRLRCNAPAGTLTAELRDQLRDRKSEIVGFLSMAAAMARQQPALVPLQPLGTRTPIYAVPGGHGDVFSFSDLSKHLGDDQPFFALQPPGLDGRTEPMEQVEEIARYFAGQILEYQPDGPYVIAGHCSGAATALELARFLGERGAEIQCLAFFGPLHPSTFRGLPRLLFHAGKVGLHLREMAKLPSFGARRRYVGERLRARLASVRERDASEKTDPVLARRARLAAAADTAVLRYTPAPYHGRVCMFLPNKAWLRSGTAPLRWLRTMPHAEIYYGPDNCNGFGLMLLDPDAPAIAELYRQSIRRGEGIR